MSQPVVCCLGRYGDICNALPIAWQLHEETGQKVKFVVAKEFWKILDGCSYVQPVVWDIKYNEIPKAMTRLADSNAVICQTHSHPDNRRLTDSYQKESWRVAGWLDRFCKLPLVFDKRDSKREERLVNEIFGAQDAEKPIILFSGKSVSSPFSFVPFLEMINKEFSATHRILNMSDLRAEAIYDVLGLMDRAAVLVTVDTMHLHMARASKVPVIAIINEGWLGSVPLANVKRTFRYSEATPKAVVDAIRDVIEK